MQLDRRYGWLMVAHILESSSRLVTASLILICSKLFKMDCGSTVSASKPLMCTSFSTGN